MALAMVLVGLMASGNREVTASTPIIEYSCFPSCALNDGKMLAIAQLGLEANGGTIADATTMVGLLAPPVASGAGSITIGVFDGDAGPGAPWDAGTAPRLKFELFNDSNGDNVPEGSALMCLISNPGIADSNACPITPANNPTNLPSNAWSLDYTATLPDTLTKNYQGLFQLLLKISISNPTTAAAGTNGFKIRTSGGMSLQTTSFGFQGFTFAGSPNTGTFQGAFDFDFYLSPTDSNGNPITHTKVDLWDGDFDYGHYTCSTNDTNDVDTNTANNVDPGFPTFPYGLASFLKALQLLMR